MLGPTPALELKQPGALKNTRGMLSEDFCPDLLCRWTECLFGPALPRRGQKLSLVLLH
jgi:hypothetical protein